MSKMRNPEPGHRKKWGSTPRFRFLPPTHGLMRGPSNSLAHQRKKKQGSIPWNAAVRTPTPTPPRTHKMHVFLQEVLLLDLSTVTGHNLHEGRSRLMETWTLVQDTPVSVHPPWNVTALSEWAGRRQWCGSCWKQGAGHTSNSLS